MNDPFPQFAGLYLMAGIAPVIDNADIGGRAHTAREPRPPETVAMEAVRAHADVSALLKQVHEIGRQTIAPAAGDVDSRARFPHEALTALKKLELLSAYVPCELGGMGLSVADIARICEILGRYCGSTALIFAMHQIQVACIVHHGRHSVYFKRYLKELVSHQYLIASATTELGIGGDLRTSLCSITVSGRRFVLVKSAPVISYGETADQILVTCRRSPDAPSSDQVHVLVDRSDYQLEPLSTWDTLGFRGTCSLGFVLRSAGEIDQVLPVPFADILSDTMHPFSHIVWASVWSGIAGDAVRHARTFVRDEARKTPAVPPTSALRLAEVDIVLQGMRHNVESLVADYRRRLDDGNPDALRNFAFAIRVNNLKLASSQLVVDIVGRAMLICGIAGYRNDSKRSLGRHLRDAYGAALMVNNDRILGHNASMLLMHKEEE
jgi:acyl-CoA dehydrogenase